MSLALSFIDKCNCVPRALNDSVCVCWLFIFTLPVMIVIDFGHRLRVLGFRLENPVPGVLQ